MASSMNPVIAQKLDAFGRRWRRLILLRGIAEGVIVLLGGMTLVAMIDRLLVMPDSARLLLSGAAYLATAVVLWLVCLRRLLQLPGPKEFARMVEKARPDLREDLISAIELGSEGHELNWDSPVFRSLLQESVASRMGALDMNALLPNRLISRWLYLAVGVVMFCGFLALLPGLHYDRLLMRALAPMANLERVSSVQIRLVEPTGEEPTVPRGDNVPITVEITGPEPAKVLLETFRPGVKDGSDRLQMSQVKGAQFTATISADTDTIEFRVRAGDGITRLYTLHTIARPQVIQFEKTYHYPAYARLPNSKVTEDHGDLTALEDSEVELKLKLDQPVKEAELRIEQASGSSKINLSATSAGELTGRLPMRTAGTYSVHLVGARTGFENKFSPQYEIRTIADVVPRVAITSPDKDLVVPSDEVIGLHGVVADDLALARVTQMIQVNDGSWNEISLLDSPTQAQVSVSRKWDLLSLKANPGDRVTTKLVAVDLKGNRGESMPLHLVISSPGFDAHRLRAMEMRRRLQETFKQMEEGAQDLKKAVSHDAANKLKGADEFARKQLVVSATTAIEELQRKVDQTQSQLNDVLKQVAPGRESSDLALVGRVLSVLAHDHLPRARRELDKIPFEKSGDEPVVARLAADAAARVGDIASTIQSAHNDLFSADEAAMIVGNTDYLAKEQARVNQRALNESKDPKVWEALARRQGTAVKESRLVEEMLATMGQHITRSFADRAKRVKDSLQAARAPLEKVLTNSPTRELLAKPSTDLQRGIENALNNLQPLEREMAMRADKAREQLEKLAGDAFTPLEKLRRDLEDLAGIEKQQADPRRKDKPDPKLEARAKELKEKIDAGWNSATAQLKDRATVEEMKTDADAYFVSDVTKAAQAMGALRAASEGQAEAAVAPLKNLEQALKTLEAAQSLSEINAGLKQLAEEERYELRSADAATTRPKDWNWTNQKLQQAPTELKNARLPEDVARTLASASGNAQANEVRREMADRQNPQNKPRSVAPQLEDLSAAVNRAQEMAQPALEQARNAIAEAAPALSEMMSGLARASQKLENDTRTASQPQASAAAPKEDQKQLLDRQTGLNEQIEDLKAALRRDANVQDITARDGRDRARDADDAVAMLREPPQKAADALREAAMSHEQQTAARALDTAAEQQKKLSDALGTLAKHYQNVERGKADDTRMALRKAEEELGVKSALDAAYDKSEMLEALKQQTPQEMLEALEKELAKNPLMKEELKSISDDTLERAKSALQQAAAQQKGVTKSVNDLINAKDPRAGMAEQVRKLADQARQIATKDVPSIRMDSTSAKANAEAELDRAGQSLQQAADQAPKDFNQSPEQLGKQMAELTPALQKASADLRAAANKASQALKQAPPTDPKATAAQSTQKQATKAADQAAQLAQQAQAMADQLKGQAGSTASQMAQAAAQEGKIANNLSQTGADIARAGRHESRMDTPQGKALQQVGQETQSVASQQVPQAQQALSGNEKAAAAQPMVIAAEKAVDQQVAALQAAINANAAAPAQSADKSAAKSPDAKGEQGQQGQSQQGQQGSDQASQSAAASPEESKQKARTLDRLDSAINPSTKPGGQQQQGQQGQQSQNSNGQSKDAQQAAAEAAAQAAKAQQASMMNNRKNGQPPGAQPPSEGEGNGEGAEMIAGELPPGMLPQVRGLRPGEWGKLPPKVAQGLMEARQETLSGEYRAMVETYFRVIAERAKDKK